ncbi:MAG: ATP-binding protein [Pseudomonadota bacterium]
MRLLPRGLFGRLVLILLCGLVLAQLATAYINLSERDQLLYRASGMQMAQRIADLSKLLDSVAPEERRRIVSVFNAPPLAISLDRPRMAPDSGPSEVDIHLSMFGTVLSYALGEGMQVQVVKAAGVPERYGQRGWRSPPGMPMMQGPMGGAGMQMMHPESMFFVVQVVLRDGAVVTFDSFVSPESAGMPLRLGLTLLVLLGIVVALSLVAVRWVTGPLAALASAAEKLGGDIHRQPLPETGPLEARRAARAFNTMQGRLSRFIADRTRILTAMSHDLKTPITRLRLRTELLEDQALRGKFARDLQEMESMVTQTLDFMRDASASEPVQRVDFTALLESLQTDYQDMGNTVEVEGRIEHSFNGRPLALRRCLTNLLDNAIRYGRRATLKAEDGADRVTIRVLDEGPGIPEAELEHAFEPFFRGESSRSRETGGSGLGLGIARNIARAHGGDLVLRNRPGGGLEATLTLPRNQPAVRVGASTP